MIYKFPPNDDIQKNIALGLIRSNWNREYSLSRLLPKDCQPVEFIYSSEEQLIHDKSNYGSPMYYKKRHTEYKIRIKGKGLRRIYVGYRIIGYKWDEVIQEFFTNDYGDCPKYYYVEVEQKKIVVISSRSLD
jgi:hypothetical protein